MLRRLLFVALIGLLVPTLAFAQPKAGDWELTLIGAGSNDNDFDTGSFEIGGSLGYFFSKEFEAQLRQSVGFADFGESSWAGSTVVALDFHFDMGKFQPFVGGFIGGIYGDDVNETGVGGPEAGVKFFVNNTTFIFGRVAYEFFFESGDDVDEGFDDGRFVYGIGIGFLF